MLINDNITNFTHLSNFSSLKDFNNNFEMWLADHKKDLTKKEYIIIRRLSKFSAKVWGVSNISIRRLIQAIEQYDNTKVSSSTFHRAKRKAIKLGIISVHTTKRTDNSQSSNIYVFNTYSTQNDIPCKKQKQQEVASNQHSSKSKMTGDKADKNIKANKSKVHRKQSVKFDAGVNSVINQKELQICNTSHLDYTFVSQSVHPELIKAIKPFFPLADDIYAIYKRLQIATRNHSDTLITHMNNYIQTFKQVIYRAKNKRIRSFYAYLYRAFERTCDEIVMRQNARNKGVYYDWTSD